LRGPTSKGREGVGGNGKEGFGEVEEKEERGEEGGEKERLRHRFWGDG